MANAWHQTGAVEQPQRPLFIGIDDDGVGRIAVAQERDHAVVARLGVLHGAVVAADREGHDTSMTRGSDRNPFTPFL